MAERFCPNCGSEDVKPRNRDIVGFRSNPGTWECRDCAYSGLMPEGDPEDFDFDMDIEEFKIESGINPWKTLAYVMAASGLLLGIIYLAAILRHPI